MLWILEKSLEIVPRRAYWWRQSAEWFLQEQRQGILDTQVPVSLDEVFLRLFVITFGNLFHVDVNSFGGHRIGAK
jgi:hypothetical protein